ncbi:hypothetical protein IE81DRAFT_349077 [Ceraceosorus guamensis]|uniref:Uncharacterized protein n=1 Tax=Ceraceosorus guamensis TaxID=1522189 RepID=A0A316VUM5_9BASI|nr:hypothetical protein IE81DRAFT_349077 [Ceraceosorus guamensis]PWN40598.1 hypothetical protein IE81DRAFT_349077 [Ceraceosorus guamensis]
MLAKLIFAMAIAAAGSTYTEYPNLRFDDNSPWIYKMTSGLRDYSVPNAAGLFLNTCRVNYAQTSGSNGSFGPYHGKIALFCRTPTSGSDDPRDLTGEVIDYINKHVREPGTEEWKIESTPKESG